MALEALEPRSAGEHITRIAPHFPISEKWRLIIDGFRQEDGPLAFEIGQRAEPGYVEGSLKAFDMMINSLGQPIDADFIEALHDKTISKIIELNKVKELPKKNFREGGVFFSYKPLKGQEPSANLTKEGLVEIIEYSQFSQIKLVDKFTNDTPFDLDTDIDKLYEQLKNSMPSLSTANQTRSEIQKIVNSLVAQYYIDIKNAGNDKELKLQIIAKFIQKLEVLHPFEDANCRTFVILLLNKLLIENGFSPVILFNPNQFDGFSNAQLVSAIKEGMKTFEHYCKICADTHKKVNDLITKNPFFNREKKLKELLPADSFTSLYVIEHVAQQLQKNTPKHYEDYLKILKKIYHENMIEFASTLTSARNKGVIKAIVDTHEMIGKPLKNDLENFYASIQEQPSPQMQL